MTLQFAIQLFALLLVCFYAATRLRFELQMMQQNSYRVSRYLRWLKGDLVSTTRVTDVLMLVMLVGGFFTRWSLHSTAIVGLLALYRGVRELSLKYKKPLVFTARAKRLYAVGMVLILGSIAFALMSEAGVIGQAGTITAVFLSFDINWVMAVAMSFAVASPVVMCLAVWILSPVERAMNRWYVNDARRILREMPRLTVIGITGSYGKTSTKHYLHRILSERFSVVMTPGSFNTTLGVVRTIRENLKPYTEVFIVEMGAKQVGDIAEICELVKPSIGIITAVGEQHLESFKTIENVQRTKFELIDSLPADGTAILNDDFEYIASRPVNNVAQVFRYASDSTKADFRLADVAYGRDGTSFAIETPEGITTEPFTTRLVGIHNLSNILAGYIAGRTLGMTDSEMRYAIASIEQVEHRLNIKHTPGGITIIDDAFNSNPHGAAMALDVLSGFTGGRRIVVTPGMIELGTKQEHYNRELGRQMAASCDIAVIVGEYNREAILEGLASENFAPEKIYVAATFADASRHVSEIARAGDTILYENDLPDTFK
jgi:UDP-N-acetylmuramoyl-tripeptide--D-alanyl-D-alanine ligase